MQECYKILGISEDASNEEIESAYQELKRKYSKERFEEGEVGNNAAKKLTQVENAYNELKELRNSRVHTEKGDFYDFSEVENLIRAGKTSDAQELLDNISDRTAEWHYLQSVIFYKKNWITESKKQLEIAMDMEPKNKKYSDAYTKLKQRMDYNKNQFHSGNVNYSSGRQDGNQQYNDGRQNNNSQQQMGGGGCNDCFTFCATWCCMDMLCSMCCR